MSNYLICGKEYHSLEEISEEYLKHIKEGDSRKVFKFRDDLYKTEIEEEILPLMIEKTPREITQEMQAYAKELEKKEYKKKDSEKYLKVLSEGEITLAKVEKFVEKKKFFTVIQSHHITSNKYYYLVDLTINNELIKLKTNQLSSLLLRFYSSKNVPIMWHADYPDIVIPLRWRVEHMKEYFRSQ